MGFQLEFFGTQGRRVSDDRCGVILSCSKTDKTKMIRFTFSEEASEKIAPTTSTIVYAIAGTRLYFKEAMPKVGFKLTENDKNKTKNRYLGITASKNGDLWVFAGEHAGSYDLKYDADIKLWYIETAPVFRGQYGREV